MKYKHFRKPSSGIDMTPMMDIIFLVLIFFMVGATFEMNRALNMNLPRSFSSEGTISQNRILIEINSKNDLAVNGVRVSLNELSNSIISHSNSNDSEIYIMADEIVPYKLIIDVMDLIKILGFEKISLVTDIKKEL